VILDGSLTRKCVKAVKISYCAVVLALDFRRIENNGLEELGVPKVLSKPSNEYAIYLLDEVPPQTAKLTSR